MADRALVIGIDAYTTDPAIGPLRGAVYDARGIGRLLRETLGYSPDAIHYLLDAQATRTAIVQAIESHLIAGTQPGDRVFLFFAGHGIEIHGNSIADYRQALIPVDAHVDESSRTIRHLLYSHELGWYLEHLADRKVTVVIDACHSGGMTRSLLDPDSLGRVRTPLALHQTLRRWQAEANPPTAGTRAMRGASADHPVYCPGSMLASHANRTVWTAVQCHQYALEDHENDPPSGVFTQRFVQALTEPSAVRPTGTHDVLGSLTHLELWHWLSEQSEAYCRSLPHICRLGLTPTLEVHTDLRLQPVAVSLQGRTAAEPSVASLPDLLETGVLSTAPSASPVVQAEQALTAPHTGQATSQASPQVIGQALPSPSADSEVSLRILPHAQTRRGERVRFEISSRFDGYLLLLDINPAGQLTQIYPNPLSERQGKGNRIVRDQSIVIPDATYGFEFMTQEPLGSGQLLAIVSAEPVDMDSLWPVQRSLVPVPVGADHDYIQQLSEILNTPWTTWVTDSDGQSYAHERRRRWSYARMVYHTQP